MADLRDLQMAVEFADLPTLRDRFAMAALTGLLSSETAENAYPRTDDGYRLGATDAYRWADAMLAARASALKEKP